MIETDLGTQIRDVAAASPLRADVPPGDAAEEATHDAAATWGLPDFVFHAGIVKVGQGAREVGDGLVLVGDRGLVIQVKCRVNSTSDSVRETSWIRKSTAKALRQGSGTIRRLQAGPVRLTNARGRSIDVDGKDHNWIVVVVIDHPDVPQGTIPSLSGCTNPAVVLHRRDWEFIFVQLKSTRAVAAYLARIAGEGWELGMETARYFQLAQADLRAQPPVMDGRWSGTGARHMSAPLLPLDPVGDTDKLEHRVVRSLLEDVAQSPTGGRSERDRLLVLSTLDGLPLSARSSIGSFLLNNLNRIAAIPPEKTMWALRKVIAPVDGDPTTQLAYGVCSRRAHPEVVGAFRTWVALVHYELLEKAANREELWTIGVLLTPRRDRVLPWDTTMAAIRGDLRLDAPTLDLYRRAWRDPKHMAG